MRRENLEEERLVLTDEELQLEVKKLGRYIDPLSDWGFKKIFGSELNKDLLIELLNVIIDDPKHHITSIEFTKNEYKGFVKNDRNAIFDLSCKTESGDRFIVEMQNSAQAYFLDRMIYYSTFPIQEQGEIGNWNYRLESVIVIGILNFRHNRDVEVYDKFIYSYHIREDDTSEMFSRKLRFILVELADFDKDIDEKSSQQDKWLYVLKNLSRLIERPVELRNKIFMRLFEVAEMAALSREEQLNYIKVMRTENDIINQIDFARSEGERVGMERGIEKGKMEGKAEGRLEGKAEVALSMKQNGVAVEIIANWTGLSISQIGDF